MCGEGENRPQIKYSNTLYRKICGKFFPIVLLVWLVPLYFALWERDVKCDEFSSCMAFSIQREAKQTNLQLLVERREWCTSVQHPAKLYSLLITHSLTCLIKKERERFLPGEKKCLK
jgi:hypothetical protein